MGWERMRGDKERGKRARRIPKIAGDRKAVRKASNEYAIYDPIMSYTVDNEWRTKDTDRKSKA